MARLQKLPPGCTLPLGEEAIAMRADAVRRKLHVTCASGNVYVFDVPGGAVVKRAAPPPPPDEATVDTLVRDMAAAMQADIDAQATARLQAKVKDMLGQDTPKGAETPPGEPPPFPDDDEQGEQAPRPKNLPPSPIDGWWELAEARFWELTYSPPIHRLHCECMSGLHAWGLDKLPSHHLGGSCHHLGDVLLSRSSPRGVGRSALVLCFPCAAIYVQAHPDVLTRDP